jgi:hypothetical protein
LPKSISVLENRSTIQGNLPYAHSDVFLMMIIPYSHRNVKTLQVIPRCNISIILLGF